jgi:hypothetical protein
MRWCNRFGVCKNPNKFGDDIVLDLGVGSDNMEDIEKNPYDESVAAIRLNRDDAEHLVRILQNYLSED